VQDRHAARLDGDQHGFAVKEYLVRSENANERSSVSIEDFEQGPGLLRGVTDPACDGGAIGTFCGSVVGSGSHAMAKEDREQVFDGVETDAANVGFDGEMVLGVGIEQDGRIELLEGLVALLTELLIFGTKDREFGEQISELRTERKSVLEGV
jgi:hypothetical protein